MEELFPILLFIMFIVLPLLEKALKGKATPPEQRPPRRPPVGETRVPGERKRPEVTSGGVLTERGGDGSESAADMVPEDLWAVLTGERRPPAPQPRPTPPPARPAPTPQRQRQPDPVEATPWRSPGEEEQVDAMLRRQEEERQREIRARDERIRRSRLPRPEVVREETRVVSLETPLGDPEERHRRFHDRMDRIAASEVGRAPQRAPDRGAALRATALGSPAELRQAAILQEVLGPPRSLRSLEETIGDR